MRIFKNIEYKDILPKTVVVGVDAGSNYMGVSFWGEGMKLLRYLEIRRSSGESFVEFKVGLRVFFKEILEQGSEGVRFFWEAPFIGFVGAVSPGFALRTTIPELLVEMGDLEFHKRYIELEPAFWRKIICKHYGIKYPRPSEQKEFAKRVVSEKFGACGVTDNVAEAILIGFAAQLTKNFPEADSVVRGRVTKKVGRSQAKLFLCVSGSEKDVLESAAKDAVFTKRYKDIKDSGGLTFLELEDISSEYGVCVKSVLELKALVSAYMKDEGKKVVLLRVDGLSSAELVYEVSDLVKLSETEEYWMLFWR